MATKSYPTSDVAQMTGFSIRQLDYWARQNILAPGIKQSCGPGTRRLYSLDDIVQLRFIRRLKQQGWSIQKIRQAIVQLRDVMENPDPLKNAVLVYSRQTILAICKTREGQRLLLDTLTAGGQHVLWIVLETLVDEPTNVAPQPTRPCTADSEVTV